MKGPLPIRTADSLPARFLGLMGRRRWPSRWGGIFFPWCRSLHTFFTFLEPDILFLDDGKKVLKIIPSAGPWRVFWGPRRTCHCLELPSGRARELGLRPGSDLAALSARTKEPSQRRTHVP